MTVTEQGCEQRLCSECFEYRQLSEFRRRRKDSDERMPDCRFCHNRKESERSRSVRQKRHGRKLKAGLTALAGEKDALRLAFLSRKLVGSFGSTEKFANELCGLYQQAESSSFTRFRILSLALNLIEHEHAQRPDPRQMSDAELYESMADCCREFIASNPEVAVTAAAELGWIVVPPEDESQL